MQTEWCIMTQSLMLKEYLKKMETMTGLVQLTMTDLYSRQLLTPNLCTDALSTDGACVQLCPREWDLVYITRCYDDCEQVTSWWPMLWRVRRPSVSSIGYLVRHKNLDPSPSLSRVRLHYPTSPFAHWKFGIVVVCDTVSSPFQSTIDCSVHYTTCHPLTLHCTIPSSVPLLSSVSFLTSSQSASSLSITSPPGLTTMFLCMVLLSWSFARRWWPMQLEEA